MLRSFYWYIMFGITLLATTPKLLIVRYLEKQGKVKEKDDYVFKQVKKWARGNVKRSGAKLNIHGLENIPEDGPVVFVSNHQGAFDIALFLSHIPKPTGFIAKIEMKTKPLLSNWMKHIYCVFMDRQSLKGSASAILEGVNLLKQGKSLVIFPEGTRSKSDQIGEFKPASMKLAIKAKAPIIPVTIDGSYKVFEKNNKRITPDTVNVFIHPVIETKNLTKEEQNELCSKVYDIIRSKLPLQENNKKM